MSEKATKQFPLSYAQQRLWFLEQYNEKGAQYNIPYAVYVDGDIQINAFKSAVLNLVKRHESLRTVFCMDSNGHAHQVLIPEIEGFVDKIFKKGRIEEDKLDIALEKEIHNVFDLSTGPLIQVKLYQLNKHRQLLIINMHHIISDGWSMEILLRDLFLLYGSAIHGHPANLPELSIQYIDFAVWQRKYLSEEVGEKQLNYWLTKLKDIQPLALPSDKPRPQIQSFSGMTINFMLDKSLSLALKQIATQQRCTLFMVLLTGFKILLARYSQQEDIIIGSPIANRHYPQVENIIGFFVNTLLLRSSVKNQPIQQLLQAVKETCLQAYQHQDMPLEVLVDKLKVERDQSRSPLFQVMFALQNISEPLMPNYEGLDFSSVTIETPFAKFDLTLSMTDSDDKISGSFEFNTDLYEKSTIQLMVSHYQNILKQMSINLDQSVAFLDFLTPQEYQQLRYDYHEPQVKIPTDKTITQLFEAQVQKTPDVTALTFKGKTFTYRELDTKANQLAHAIEHYYQNITTVSLASDVLIGLCVERSFELVIGILGILKAGCAYVPIDPQYPQSRIEYILEDTQTVLVLTQSFVLERIPYLKPIDGEILCLDTFDYMPWNKAIPKSMATSRNLAYIIYTSGTTGQPKGVLVEHQNLVNHMLWMKQRYPLEKNDKVLLKTPYVFDASVWEIFLPIICGAESVILTHNKHGDVEYLLNTIHKSQVSIIQFVPSLLALFVEQLKANKVESYINSLRYVFVGGEALSKGLYSKFSSLSTDAVLINLYGPTETTIEALTFNTNDANIINSTIIPIGKPILNTHIYIFDKHCNLIPKGCIGELHIGGNCLSRGYLNQVKLTHDRFILDPFISKPARTKDEVPKLYKTGDLVRYLSDGNLEYVARNDSQVKIRGHRVELEEIEAVLHRHKHISQAVVIYHKNEGISQIIAYYVTVKNIDLTSDKVKLYLSKYLPAYMIPSVFISLDVLPVGINGKPDRKALPLPDSKLLSKDQYVLPRSQLEQTLVDCISMVLKIDKIGVYDNLFALGMDSISSIRIKIKIEQHLQVNCSVSSLFKYQTISELADFISKTKKSLIKIPVIDRTKLIPLSYAQQRLWFLDKYNHENTQYNIPYAVYIDNIIEVNAFKQAVYLLVKRHEILRTVFTMDHDGHAYQTLVPEFESFKDNLFETSSLTENVEQNILAQNTQARFDLSLGPLIRVKLFQISKKRQLLMIVMHHIVSDAWSMDILLRDLFELYDAILNHRQIRLPKLDIQYSDFAIWQRNYLSGEVGKKQLDYWLRQLTDIEVLALPTDKPRPQTQTYNGIYLAFSLDKPLSHAIRDFARSHGYTLFMILLTGFKILLARYSNQEDIAVGTPIANRHYAQVENLIGFFINTLVLRTKIKSQSVDELLNQVRRTCFDAYQNQDIPFEMLVDKLNIERDQSISPLFQVMFILQQTTDPKILDAYGLNFTQFPVENSFVKYDLTVSAHDSTDGIQISFGFNTDLYQIDTIKRMMRHYQSILQQIVKNVSQSVLTLPFLSHQEYHQLIVNWNETQAEFSKYITIAKLFEAQVISTPDNIALIFENETLTFRELNTKANQLAHAIGRNYQRWTVSSLQPDSLIALCVERSFEMVIGILGILKAGCAYVPIDSQYPQARINFILEDTQTSLIITSTIINDIHCFENRKYQVLCLDTFDYMAWGENIPASLATPQSLAYVIYTSGTTGQPKGVAVEQISVINYLQWAKGFYHPNKLLRFDCSSGIAFDFTITTSLGAIASGHECVLCDDRVKKDVKAYLNYLDANRIDVVKLTPSYFSLMCDYVKENEVHLGLKTIILGGEPIIHKAVLDWNKAFPKCRVINHFGPTESTVGACIYPVENIDQNKTAVIPIGKPGNNINVYVANDSQSLQPPLSSGELYIGGQGLARGYLNQVELTHERFINNPFISTNDKLIGKNLKIYKTGDIACWLHDGNLKYIGRNDSQIKLRGFRIELGEIESALSQHEQISQVSVLVYEYNNNRLLVAYYVPIGENLTSDLLKEYSASRLPDYMIPTLFIALTSLPLTINGKIDRKALPNPDMSRVSKSRYVPPRNEQEHIIMDCLCAVLGIDKVSIHDNFFTLGLDSISSIRVQTQVENRLRVNCPVNALFNYQTIATLAKFLSQSQEIPRKIPVIRQTEFIPLSFSQQRIWFIHQFEQKSSHYNINYAMLIEDFIEVKCFKNAVFNLVERHESLRTVFKTDDSGQAYQIVLPHPEIFAKELFQSDKVKEAQLEAELVKESLYKFNLSTGPLIRIKLYQLGPQRYALMINIHHIVSDGWSTNILFRDLFEFYECTLKERTARLPKLPIQYQDFSLWQRTYLKNDVCKKQLAYWLSQLKGIEPIELTTDKMRPKVQTYTGKSIEFTLDKTLSADLKQLAKSQGCTLFMVLLTGFKILLARYSNQEDIVVGSPIANRHYPQVEDLIGFFVNTLLLRSIVRNKSIETLLQDVKQTCLDAYQNQDIPFEMLVDKLKIDRDSSRSPLFQVMFVLQNTRDTLIPRNMALNIIAIEIEDPSAKFDLTVAAIELSERIQGSIRFNTDLYEAATIKRMTLHYENILRQMVKDICQLVSTVPLLTTSEYKQLMIDWNNTASDFPKDITIHALFESQVAKQPDNIALSFDGKMLTYHELNIKANQLAYAIRHQYQNLTGTLLTADTLIGLCIERSLEMIIAMLGILKAGGAYVPIDPKYPKSRINYILNDTQISLIITQKFILNNLPYLQSKKRQILCLDNFDYSSWEQINPCFATSSQNLAYIIYTSGTTGYPKGVMVEHSSVNNVANCIGKAFGIKLQTRVLQLASICFDASVYEWAGTLLNGGTLYVLGEQQIPPHEDLNYILNIYRIEVFGATPSILESISNDNLPYLKTVIAFGERCTQKVIEKWSNVKLLMNGFGPTETTIFSHLSILQNYRNITIGKPINNVKAYVLDSELQPVPIGVVGELYIGGAGVTRGYLNQPKLTNERFIKNQFIVKAGQKLPEHSTLYKSGDLVRWLDNGTVEYIGRNDFQVKIRGFRIELGEIESELSKHKNINQVVVIIHEKNNHKQLVAYYIANQGVSLSSEQLRKYLLDRLPEYMVPSFFIPLKSMPLTMNGKLDRKALPQPEFRSDTERFASPRNKLESKLCTIWQACLGIRKVGIHDDFFEIGGDSILSIQLLSLLRKENLYCHVKDIFQCRTIAKLAKCVNQNEELKIEADQGLLSGKVNLLPIQLWFFDKKLIKVNHWNQSFLVKVPLLDVNKLNQAIRKLVNHHDALRLTFPNGRQFYRTQINIPQLQCLDKSKVSENELQQILTEWQSHFNIEHGPLWQIGYINGYKDDSARLYFALHHLIIDAVSWRILIEDLKSYYQGKSVEKKTSSYRQWVNSVKYYANNNRPEFDYWYNQIDGQPDYFSLSSICTEVNTAQIKLNKILTNRLINQANQAYHTQINDLLLTALAYALKVWHHSETSYITLEGHGREHLRDNIDVSRTVGWFTSMYPTKLEIKDNLEKSIKSIKESQRKTPNKGIGYGALKYLAKQQRLKNHILPPISFNYLGQFGEKDSLWHIVTESSGINVHPDNIDTTIIKVNGLLIDGMLQFMLSCKLTKSFTNRLAEVLKSELEKIIAHCIEKVSIEYTPSDFNFTNLKKTHNPSFEPYFIINKSKPNKPMILLPPGGAGGEAYLNNIVPAITDRPLIVFNNYLQDSQDVIDMPTSFEAMAEKHMQFTLNSGVSAPYILLGHSYGAVLAYEMALQLVNAGVEVVKLFLLDPIIPTLLGLSENEIINTYSKSTSHYYLNYYPKNPNNIDISLYKATRYSGDKTTDIVIPFKYNGLEKFTNINLDVLQIDCSHNDLLKPSSVRAIIHSIQQYLCDLKDY